jgi:hypothetical protein
MCDRVSDGAPNRLIGASVNLADEERSFRGVSQRRGFKSPSDYGGVLSNRQTAYTMTPVSAQIREKSTHDTHKDVSTASAIAASTSIMSATIRRAGRRTARFKPCTFPCSERADQTHRARGARIIS